MGDKYKSMRSEIADEVFYDLPSDKDRKKMTPKQLAKLLSECKEKDSPKYILLSHAGGRGDDDE